MLSNNKKAFYRNEEIRLLKASKCLFYKKQDFYEFMLRFREESVIKNDDFLEATFVREFIEAFSERFQSIHAQSAAIISILEKSSTFTRFFIIEELFESE